MHLPRLLTPLLLLSACCLFSCAQPGQQRVDLAAVKDFRTEVKGFAPYYIDQDRLAINAGQYKTGFAAAETTFHGPDGTYDLTLHTLTETDGESTYQVFLNEKLVGEFTNPPGDDYAAAQQTWPKVNVKTGDVIRVTSAPHSNGKIPEGDGFAYSRGRWTKLELTASR